jgi:hypothetical protein
MRSPEEEAAAQATVAMAADLEHWARITSADGRVGINDLIQVLDAVRDVAGQLTP